MDVNDLPVMLKIAGRNCLVVGGGKVAARRAASFADSGAKVTVIAPEFCEALIQSDQVTRIQRAFADADLEGVFLLVVATDDKQLNDHISDLANAKNVLINRADDPAAGDISVLAHAHCGPMTVAVHTHGISALAAATIRDELLEHIDNTWPALLTAMAPFRKQLQQTISETQLRQNILKQMADTQALSIIRDKGVIHYIKFCESLVAQAQTIQEKSQEASS